MFQSDVVGATANDCDDCMNSPEEATLLNQRTPLSTPIKTKATYVKVSDEQMIILMLVVNEDTASGMDAYRQFAKLDEKGHPPLSFRSFFTPLAAKAKELLAKHSNVDTIEDGATTPKKRGDRKRKAADMDADGLRPLTTRCQ